MSLKDGGDNSTDSGGGLSGRSDDTCDQNLDKLNGFQIYLPLYNLYTGKNLDFEKDIIAKNDLIRGVDYGKLSQAAHALFSIGSDFARTRDEVNAKVSGVIGGSWHGEAANAFGSHLREFGARSLSIDGDLSKLSGSITSTTAAAKKIVAGYGRTVDTIDWGAIRFDVVTLAELIAIYKMETGPDDLVDKLEDGLADLIGFTFPDGWAMDAAMSARGTRAEAVLSALCLAEDKFLSFISGLVRTVLDPGFKNPFEQNLQLLDAGSRTADAGIRQAFQGLIQTSESIDQSPFDGLSAVPERSAPEPGTGGAIGVDSPDGQTHAKIKVDAGDDGKPAETYDVDFSKITNDPTHAVGTPVGATHSGTGWTAPGDTPAHAQSPPAVTAWTAPASDPGGWSYDPGMSGPTDRGSFSGDLFDPAPAPASTSLAAASFAPSSAVDSDGSTASWGGIGDYDMVGSQGAHHSTWDSAHAGVAGMSPADQASAPGDAGLASLSGLGGGMPAVPMLSFGGGQGAVEDRERSVNTSWRTLFDDDGSASVSRMNGVLGEDAAEGGAGW